MKVAVILAAAGSGQRLKARKPKALVVLNGKTILRHAFEALDRAWPFEEFVVTAPVGQIEQIRKALGPTKRRVQVVEGGQTRSLSVLKALAVVSDRSDYVLIHDAARPLVEPKTVRDTIKQAKRTGAALAALQVSSTVKRARPNGVVAATVDRRGLYLAQTPQVFSKKLLVELYKKLGKKAALATDDAALFDGTSVRVRVVEDSPKNFKITTPNDLKLFKYYLGN